MKFVEPIRVRKKIAQIKNQLSGQGQYRDLLLFVVGTGVFLYDGGVVCQGALENQHDEKDLRLTHIIM